MFKKSPLIQCISYFLPLSSLQMNSHHSPSSVHSRKLFETKVSWMTNQHSVLSNSVMLYSDCEICTYALSLFTLDGSVGTSGPSLRRYLELVKLTILRHLCIRKTSLSATQGQNYQVPLSPVQGLWPQLHVPKNF